MAKFYGLEYKDIKPRISWKMEQTRTVLPKALPVLPKPVPVDSLPLPALLSTNSELGLVAMMDTAYKKLSGKGLCAVVIDSGVFKHRYLKEALLNSYSCNGDISDTSDQFGHGTHMAGIIASSKRGPGMGIAPQAKIISIKVTRANSGEASWSSIARALDMVYELAVTKRPAKLKGLKVSVVNLSFNGLDCLNPDDNRNFQIIMQKINRLTNEKIAVVVSAGNYYEQFKGMSSGLGYPACNTDSINVAAANNYKFQEFLNRTYATFSQRYISGFTNAVTERMVQKKHKDFILAPGACSVSLNNSKDPKMVYSYLSGTSSAAALVSGCILLMQEAAVSKNGALPAVKDIKDWISKGSELVLNRAVPATLLTSVASITVPVPVPGLPEPTRFFDNRYYCGINVNNSLTYI